MFYVSPAKSKLTVNTGKVNEPNDTTIKNQITKEDRSIGRKKQWNYNTDINEQNGNTTSIPTNNSSNYTTGYIFKGNEISITGMFLATLFITFKVRKKLNCLWLGEQIKKKLHRHEYYPNLKKEERANI
jgi:hypothetical protein